MVLAALLCASTLLLAACGVDDTAVDPNLSDAADGALTPVLPAPTDDAEATTTSDTSVTTIQPTTDSSSTSSSSTAPSTVAAPETTATTLPTVPTIPTVPLERLDLDLELVATLSSPVGMASRPGSNDLFIIEQRGRIVRLPGGQAEGADTTLDIRGEVSLGNEQGLLGLAFSPDGQRLFINYTQPSGATVISSWGMEGDIVDESSGAILLTIPQPQGNHNGGQLAFGPDGYLYIGMGDGGGGGDPGQHGQNPDTLLGSILRIDVDTDDGYLIPPDNPFIDGAAPEVFIWGIRNAWRFDFDDVTGDLWIGDVGQDRFEEVTVLRAADGASSGANLGWNATEGAEPFRGGTIPDNHVAPVITYGHANGRCSLTAGEVYRGSTSPRLYGTYLYSDFCSGEIFGYRVDDSGVPTRLDAPAVDQPSSFGTDADGEMYVLSRSGGVFRILESG